MELILPIAILLGVPMAMLIVFKSNAGIMFFAACSGLVLLANLDAVVVTTAGAVVPGEGEAYVRLAVVLLSIAFAGLVFRGTSKGFELVLNGFIALILATMLFLILPGASGVSWLLDITTEDYWTRTNDFRALIISIGFALSLIVVLTGKKKHKTKH